MSELLNKEKIIGHMDPRRAVELEIQTRTWNDSVILRIVEHSDLGPIALSVRVKRQDLLKALQDVELIKDNTNV